MKVCVVCDMEFSLSNDKPGKINECEDCASETVDKYTGNMIYDHKTGPSIQINADPGLTAYINKATKLRNKGSNLANNLKVNSKKARTRGGMLYSAGSRSRRRES